MAINLTTSITKTANYQGITKIEFVFPHMTPIDSNEIIMNKGDIIVIYYITTWADDGSELSTKRYSIPYPGWPPAFTTDVKDVYSKLEQYAIAQGFIGDGLTEPLA